MSHPASEAAATRPIVIGGGWAGISAAVALAEKGEPPLLLESRPFLGGRARSFFHEESGEEIDNGQHLMMGCYSATLALLRTLGTDHLVEVDPSLSVEFRGSEGVSRLHAPSRLPAPLDVLAGMLRFDGLSIAERAALVRLGIRARAGEPESGDSAGAWLRRNRQSERLIATIWEPLIVATMNTAPKDASAELFLYLLRLSFLRGGEDASLAFPRVGLSELIAPFTDWLQQRGGAVRCGEGVTDVERRDGIWEVRTREGRYRTDHLVSALPWRVFGRLFGKKMPEGRTPEPSPQHNPILSLYLWFDRPLEEVPRFCALLGTEVEWVFNRRKILDSSQGEPRHPGLLCCVTSNTPGWDRERIERAVAEVRQRVPEIGNARLVRHLAIHEKQATFAATPILDALRPKPGHHTPGLSICGDWTDTGLPGTIEGAVRSGAAVAL